MILEYDKTKYSNPHSPETDLKSYRDYKNVIDTAYQESYLKEIKTKVLLIAEAMKKRGFEPDYIIKVLTPSREEIEKL